MQGSSGDLQRQGGRLFHLSFAVLLQHYLTVTDMFIIIYEQHNTKWTSDLTGQMLSEGYREYQRLVKWCRQLKSMSKQLPDTEEPKGYELLRMACNVKAKTKGLMMPKHKRH
eukprot:scaffold106017_cov80-Cyclotella_meneghiniana.AAC.6